MKNFSVISNILASALNSQSPGLRRKGVELLEEYPPEATNDANWETEQPARRLESSIQRRLWDLLQATLKPTIGTAKKTNKDASLKSELDSQLNSQDSEINETTINEGSVDQHDMSDELHYHYQNVSLPTDSAFDHYQSNCSFYPDLEYVWDESDDLSFLQDEKPFGASTPEDRTGNFCYKAGLSDYELPRPYHKQFDSYLSDMIQDHLMSDYHDDGCTESCEHDHTSEAG